jgi:hypothetical protein
MFRNFYLGLIWLLLVTAWANSGWAATFVDQKGGLRIEGALVDGDYAKFVGRISARENTDDPIRTVSLASPGGNVATALAMGRLIRSKWLMTRVFGLRNKHNYWVCDIVDTYLSTPSCSCDSACFLVWAAGTVRVGSEELVGLHRPYFGAATGGELAEPEIGKAYDAVTEELRSYLRQMQIPDRYFDLMMSKNSRQMHRLTERELTSLRYAPLAEEAMISTCGAVVDNDPMYVALFRKKSLSIADFGGAPLTADEEETLKRYNEIRKCGRNVIHTAQDKLTGR